MAAAFPFSVWAVAAAATLALGSPALAAPPVPQAQAHAAAATPAPFAAVGDAVITHQEFDAAFAMAARSKFYHGKPPENEVAALQREVAQSLVDDILLAHEAGRRGIRADAQSVQQAIDSYEQRYRASEQWKANRERLLPGIRAKLERDSVGEQLRSQVKQVAEPAAAEVAQYYEQNRDKFTSPEQVHVRIILMKVEPSSPQSKWDGTRDEAMAIHKRLVTGADFAEAAKLRSNDSSAANGGDLGYVHRGMLPDAVQAAIDKLQPGGLTEPLALLDGIALFRLEARKSPVLNPLEAVRERARGLLMRDRGELAWTRLLEQLRRDTPARIDESRFLPLATAGSGGAAPVR